MSTTRLSAQYTVVSRGPNGVIAAHIERALRWLSQSGIVVSNAGPSSDGAVYSFFDARSGRYRLVYAEATGYLLSFWKYLHSVKRDGRLDEQARAAADWLVRWTAEHGGSVAMGIDSGITIRRAYAFDGGICAKGLLDAFEVTGEYRYVDAAERVLRRLLAEFITEDGAVKAALDLDSGQFLDVGRVWYMTSGAFHAKIAMPLLQLSTVTGDGSLREAANRIWAWTLKQQSDDGSFPANTAMRNVNLHAHSYATEALLYAYGVLGVPAFRTAAEKAIRWIVDRQASNGSVALWHGGWKLRRRASYAMAQSIRLFLLLHTLTRRDTLVEAAARTARFLGRMQVTSANPRIDGGFYGEDIVRSGILLRKNREVTSWATMFVIQALDLLSAVQSLDFDQCVKYLF